MRRLVLVLTVVSLLTGTVLGQSPSAKEKQAEDSFAAGNELMEKRKYAEALVEYKKGLAALPDDPAILFNAGLAAFSSKDHAFALESWKTLKALEPTDWRLRTKLIQAYQALNRLSERDAERTQLFEMWKSGKPAELKEQSKYCREQFEVKGKKVMAFEHFELKGNRALRYVFIILNETEDEEAWRISLGSYDTTNAVWREMRKPPPKEGERLFHLDGYFNNGGHATYGMYFPEPSYDDTRNKVIQILSGSSTPFSTTTPTGPRPEPKPTP